MDPGALLPLAKAHALLGVSRATFEKYVKTPGLLPTYKLPSGQRRWRRADVLALARLINREAS